ncbi:MAG: adenosylhomocysteinase [Gaiellales bacterium]
MADAAHDIADAALAADGLQRIAWAERDMPVVGGIRERFARERPLAGIRVGMCLHVTAETAVLVRALAAAGADVALCASDPLSTRDEVAAALVVEDGIAVFARHGEDDDAHYRHLMRVADHRPQLVIDDGADLIGVLHAARRELVDGVIAGMEQTTTGVIRLRAMEADGVLGFPVIAVNEAQTKHLFDNRYGTGQSAVDGIVRATNVLLAGRTFVVGGYGWCGRGLAERARGMGASVIVLEVDPLRALQAAMDGFRVMPAAQAAPLGDVFCTATGDTGVLRGEHFDLMRDGAIIANAGHFGVEIDLPALRERAVETRAPRPHVEELALADGRRLTLLADGRPVNLAAADGHPASVMDMSFANQALSAAYALRSAEALENRVYVVPTAIDEEIARLKLDAMGIAIDRLTAEQERYLKSWSEGA